MPIHSQWIKTHRNRSPYGNRVGCECHFIYFKINHWFELESLFFSIYISTTFMVNSPLPGFVFEGDMWHGAQSSGLGRE